MQLPANNWPETPIGRGTLFFAQAMSAFVDSRSHEGFRAYTLDTLGRVSEAIEVIDDSLAGRIPRAALSPIFAELKWSLDGDDAARGIAEEEIELVQSLCKDTSKSLQTIRHALVMLQERLRPSYRDALVEKVVSCIADDKSRIDLLARTGFLASHLMNAGHTDGFISLMVRERFFANDIRKGDIRTVRRFIASISEQQRSYLVIFGTTQATANIIRHIGEYHIADYDSLTLDARSSFDMFAQGDHRETFIKATVEAADPFRAASDVDNGLRRVKSLVAIPRHRLDVSWSKCCYVSAPRAVSGRSLKYIDLPFGDVVKKAINNKQLKATLSTPKRIKSSFNTQSSDRLQNAISNAATAVEVTEPGTRLVSIWSAFEILCSDPNESNEPRISHYVRHLAPIISIRYQRRVFSAVYDQLILIYKKRIRDLIRQIEGDNNDARGQFIKLMILPQYEAQRAIILQVCSDNPLALHRLFRLKTLYGTPSAAHSTIVGHFNRVQWQLHRLYRVRNNLVHAGRIPVYIDTLVMIAFEYFRDTIVTVVRAATPMGHKVELERVIAEIGFAWSMMLTRVEAKNAGKTFDEKLLEKVFTPI